MNCKNFPYRIDIEGCDVIIQNGAAGTFRIHKNAIAIDACIDGLTVLCGGEDLNEKYITILDLTKKRTGFNPRILTMRPSDFLPSSIPPTIQALISALDSFLGRPITLDCCLENYNELTISNFSIFCGS